MGVVAALAGQQLGGQLEVALGELPGVAAQEGELPLVVRGGLSWRGLADAAADRILQAGWLQRGIEGHRLLGQVDHQHGPDRKWSALMAWRWSSSSTRTRAAAARGRRPARCRCRCAAGHARWPGSGQQIGQAETDDRRLYRGNPAPAPGRSRPGVEQASRSRATESFSCSRTVSTHRRQGRIVEQFVEQEGSNPFIMTAGRRMSWARVLFQAGQALRSDWACSWPGSRRPGC